MRIVDLSGRGVIVLEVSDGITSRKQSWTNDKFDVVANSSRRVDLHGVKIEPGQWLRIMMGEVPNNAFLDFLIGESNDGAEAILHTEQTWPGMVEPVVEDTIEPHESMWMDVSYKVVKQ